MQVVCPHCHSPVNPEEGAAEVLCPACGSSFRLEGNGSTTGWTPQPGMKTLGRFELLASVGMGAFGTVYKARDAHLDRVVAVKVPRAGQVGGTEHRERFLREARSVAQLRHPAIVSIHEVGEHEGTPFLVSEFVQGVTLADYLTSRRPTFREAADLILPVAEALQYAHERGVVHRDVKPSNIMLEQEPGIRNQESGIGDEGSTLTITDSGRRNDASAGARLLAPGSSVKLMDFGMAKRDAGEVTMTVEGQILGTPAYMSPEQARGEGHDVDGRSDVYSLGVIFYELLTGELPFRGNTRMLLHQVLHEDPKPPRSLNDRIPRDLETVCLKALAKEPARRYQTAGAMADDLRRFLGGQPILARPVGKAERLWRWARRNPTVAGLTAAVAALLLAGLVGSLVALVRINHARVLAQFARDDATKQAEIAGQERQKALDSLERRRQLLVQLNVDKGTQLVDQGDPLGAMLWFTEALKAAGEDPAQAELQRVRLASLRRHSPKLFQVQEYDRDVPAAAFSPDGKRVAVVLSRGPRKPELFNFGEGEVRVWDPLTVANAFPPLKFKAPLNHIAFSSDGQRLVTAGGMFFIVSLSMERGCEARVWNAATGEPITPPLKHTNGVTFAGFSPDGYRVATASMDGTARLWDATTGAKLAEMSHGDSPVRQATFSPNGKVLATLTSIHPMTKKGAVAIHLWDTATGKPLATLPRTADTFTFAFSPDGRQLASTDAGYQRPHKVYLWDVAAHMQTPHSPLPHDNTVLALAYSPDGRYLATADSGPGVRLWDPATGREVRRLEGLTGNVNDLAFSPNGRSLLVCGSEGWNQAGEARLWDVATGKPLSSPLRHLHPVRAGIFSPDGAWVLTHTGVAGDPPRGEVRLWDLTPWRPRYVRPKPGEEPKPSDRTEVTVFRPVNETSGVNVAARPTASPPTGGRVVTWKDRQVEVREAASQALVTRQPLRFEAPVERAGLSPNGRYLVVIGRSDKVGVVCSLWDLQTEQRLGDPWGISAKQYTSYRYASFTFSPDSRRLFSFADMLLRDTATGGILGKPMVHSDQFEVNNVVFSPDGTLLVTCGQDGARVWDAETGKPKLKPGEAAPPDPPPQPPSQSSAPAGPARPKPVLPPGKGLFLPHTRVVITAALDPAMTRVVTTSSDDKARIWRLADGQLLTPPMDHGEQPQGAAFSADGRLLVTRSHASARVWEAATGVPVTPPLPHAAFQEAYFLDNRKVLAGSSWTSTQAAGDTALWPRWDLAPDTRPAEEWTLLLEATSGRRLDDVSGLTPLEADRLRDAWRRLRDKYKPEDLITPPEDVRAWHEAEMHGCLHNRQWFAVVFHASRLLADKPDPVALLARGWAYAEQGRHAEAAADYAQALGMLPPDVGTWYKHALLRAVAGQHEEYRRACAAIRDRFATSAATPDVADAAVFACIVAPKSMDDLTALIRRAEATLQTRPQHDVYLRTLAAAYLRAGELDKALESLGKALKIRQDFQTAWLLTALVHAQRGEKKEAREWLDKHAAWKKEPSNRYASGSNYDHLTWDERLKLDLLSREAEGLLQAAEK